MWLQLTRGAVTVKQPIMPCSAALALWSQWHIVEKFSDSTSVRSHWSPPHDKYSLQYLYWHILSTTKVFLKIELELELELEQTSNDYAVPPIWGGGAGSPSNTKSPGPRPSSIPSDILIHAAIWPQQMWAENWGGCAPLGEGELGPHLTQCV